MSLQRLTTLRELMSCQRTCLAAYIVPTADAHNSEYISAADARRAWISGFTGFTGTAVITTSKALVWTDEHYYARFEKEADLKLWTLMKQSLPETLSIEKWLTSNLTPGSVVGVDPHLITKEWWTTLQTALSQARMKLIAVDKNLVDKARYKLDDPPPVRPQNDIIYLPLQNTGKSAGQKIKELREKMLEKKASALVITALDEIAYTLNLRGSDIKNNPVFFSYLLITPNSVTLFWKDGFIPEKIVENLYKEGLKIEGKPYAQTTELLRKFAQNLSNNNVGEHSIWISNVASEAIHSAVSGEGVLKEPLTLISEVSPVALAKLIKNDVELEGIRRCHVRDGIAVVRFYKWLHDQIEAGNSITEIQASEKLLKFRKEEKYFMDSSFETIACAGENGGTIDSSSSSREIRANDVFLMDSGAQYMDGTTDITRTRHMGTPTDYQKVTSTRVLKGQITVSTALFPVGIKGHVLDILARKYLWDVGLDYAHGTSHGVGHFLSVKEGPTGIDRVDYPQHPGLKSGMILSNEPGFYKVGEFGIRHEDLLETTVITEDSKHPKASNLLGDCDGRGVLGFNILSLCPYQTKFMKIELLNKFELEFINSYHRRVFKTLGPILKDRGLTKDLKWLKKECAPITYHSNGVKQEQECNGVKQEQECNGVKQDQECNGLKQEKECNGVKQERECNGVKQEQECNGLKQERECNGVKQEQECNGVKQEQECNGVKQEQECNGVKQDQECNGLKQEKECNGVKQERECNGVKQEQECNGLKQERECNGVKQEQECNGRSDSLESLEYNSD